MTRFLHACTDDGYHPSALTMDIIPVQGVMLHQYTSSVHSSVFYVFHETLFLSLQAVYLHVLADTLGSAGVIISSICVEYRGWVIADPICSLCIGSVIFTSVLPLVAVSAHSTLLSIPPQMGSSSSIS
jgi:Co/Zn/Cd efflux system component